MTNGAQNKEESECYVMMSQFSVVLVLRLILSLCCEMIFW
jgi:hypothetical protein